MNTNKIISALMGLQLVCGLKRMARTGLEGKMLEGKAVKKKKMHFLKKKKTETNLKLLNY